MAGRRKPQLPIVPDPSSPYADIDEWLTVPLSERRRMAEELQFGKLPGDEERLAELYSAPGAEVERIHSERSTFLRNNPTFTGKEPEFGFTEKYLKPIGKGFLDIIPPVGESLFPRPKPAPSIPDLTDIPARPMQSPTQGMAPDVDTLEIPDTSVIGTRPQKPSRFMVEEGEIIDTRNRQIIDPDTFNRLSSPEEKADIEAQLKAGGLMAEDDSEPSYGMREDGTRKGKGFFGELPSADPKFPKGAISTELSSDVDIDGKKLFFPLLVPTLTREEIDALLSGAEPTDAIYNKAIAHAQQRIAQGKSPFAGEGEQVPLPGRMSTTGQTRPNEREVQDWFDRTYVDVPGKVPTLLPSMPPTLSVPGKQFPGMEGFEGKVQAAEQQQKAGIPVDPLARFPETEPLSLGGAFEQAGKSFARGIGNTSASTFKGIGLFAKELDTLMGNDAKPDDMATYRLGAKIGKWTEETFKGRPDLQRNFLLTTLFEGAGSSVPFLASGAAGAAMGAGAGATAAVTGALAGGAGLVERAPENATDSQRRLALVLGAALGATEGLPIADLFSRMNTATGGALSHALKVGTIQAVEEAIQEGFQQVGENAVVKYLYGVAGQSLTDGAIEGIGAGGMVGFLTGFLLSGKVRMPAVRPKGGEEPPPSETGAPPDLVPPSPAAKEKKPKVGDRINQEVQRIAEQFPQTLETETGKPKLYKQPARTKSTEMPIEAPDLTVIPQETGAHQSVQEPALSPMEAPSLDVAPMPEPDIKRGEQLISNIYSFIFDDEQVSSGLKKNDPESWKSIRTIDREVQKAIDSGSSYSDAYRIVAGKLTDSDISSLEGLINKAVQAGDDASYIRQASEFGMSPGEAKDSLEGFKGFTSPADLPPGLMQTPGLPAPPQLATPSLAEDVQAQQEDVAKKEVEKQQAPASLDAPIAVPNPNFDDIRSSMADAERALKQATTKEERQKQIDRASKILKDWRANPGKIRADDYKRRDQLLSGFLSRMNGEMEKPTPSIPTPGDIEYVVQPLRPGAPAETLKLPGKPKIPGTPQDSARTDAINKLHGDIRRQQPGLSLDESRKKAEEIIDRKIASGELVFNPAAKVPKQFNPGQFVTQPAYEEKPAPPSLEPPKGATPDRRRSVFLGKLGQRYIEFKSPIHAEMFDFWSKVKKDIAGGAKFDIQHAESRIRKALNLPDDANVGALANQYRTDVIAGAKKLMAEGTYQAPEPRLEYGEKAEQPPSLEPPKVTISEAELIPTRGPDGKVQWIAKPKGEERVEPLVPEKPKTEAGKFADKGDGLNEAAKELRALSHKEKSGDDVLLDNMRYASFADAVRLAKEGIESGQVKPFPFQLSNLLGIAIGDAQRVLDAAQGKQPVPDLTQEIKDLKDRVAELEAQPAPTLEPVEERPAKAKPAVKEEKNVARQPTEPVGTTPESAPEGVEAEGAQPTPPKRKPERPRTDDRGPSGEGAEQPAGSGPRIRSGLREDTGSAVSKPGEVKTVSESSGHDYIITAEDRLEEGGPKAKFKKNLAAIKLLKKLDIEGRRATPEEQQVLVKYTGWGGLKNAFSEDENWRDEARQLRDVLTEKEYETARRSIQYAHYTDPETISSIWKALQRMGLKKGSVLEPAMGTGNFFGSTPSELVTSLSRSGVEMDYISGRIAQQLYQRANIQIVPFQESTFPNDHFDVAIGNVPFSEVKIADPKDKTINNLSLSLHNYFFAKALRKVRPGGVVAFITSTGTMDNRHARAREYFASQADLLAAYRLPSGTFKGIANTEVVTDIVILRKRKEGEPKAGESWTGLDEYTHKGKTFRINEYFVNHPDHILGDMTYEGSMYRAESMTVEGDPKAAHDKLNALIDSLPKDALASAPPKSTKPSEVGESLDAPEDVKPGAFFVKDGKIYTKVGDKLLPYQPRGETVTGRITGMAGIRDAVKHVIGLQLKDAPAEEITAAQQRLGKLYDNFVRANGKINSRANRLAFDQDPDYPVLQSLEKNYDPETGASERADIFTKRTIQNQKEITSADSPESALSIVLNESNMVDFERMRELTGKSILELQSALRGLVFQDPATNKWETALHYLSGNVREKLKIAKAAAETNKDMALNVEALEAVQPKDLLPSQIDARLGAGWIPPTDVRNFIGSLLNTRGGSVRYSPQQGLWSVSGFPEYGVEARQTYGISRMPAPSLIESGLNSQVPTLYDTDRDGKRTVNEKETLAAREKLDVIKERFTKWIWEDQARAERLAAHYNEHYNHTVTAKHDGSHLTLPGKNPLITLRPSQLNGVYRGLQGNNVLFAHEVGTGKTFTMAALAMESRRLGLAKKPMIVVPNHLVEQWGGQFRLLYPAANVLLTSKKDFEKENRLKLMGRIATGDWDSVIVPFTSFTRLPISKDTFISFMRDQIAILEQFILEERAAQGDRSQPGKSRNKVVKDLEKAKERLENKIKSREAEKSSDNAVNFEETGVDMLLVDEADMFKNLFFPTRMTRVPGLPNSESQRAFDMHLKTRYITRLNNGRGVVFATGTPISNSMAEVFTMQRYLQQDVLEEAGLGHFDAWARMFGEVVTSIEMTPSGTYKQRTRFANFINVPELMKMFHQVMDVVTADEAKVERPPLKGGKPINVVSTPGPALRAYVKGLNDRVDNLKSVDPRKDNMLKITGDGRHAALDVRLRVPGAEEEPDNKINKLVKQAANIYSHWAPVGGVQLIFLDLSTPKGKVWKSKKDAKPVDDEAIPNEEEEIWQETSDEVLEREGVYGMMRDKLIRLGVKRDEIAFVHDAKTDKEKDTLFAKVNSGKIRILMGSTEKMGAGTNVQQRAIALHNLDAPWRPRDIEQRIGRVWRFGNLLYKFSQALAKKEAKQTLSPEEQQDYARFKGHEDLLRDFHVQVYNYATEAPSFDVYMWQTLESKARVISQIMRGDPNTRTIQDIDATVLNAAEMKAIASGNPMVLEKVGVDADVRKYGTLKKAYEDNRYSTKKDILFYESRITSHRETKRKAEAELKHFKQYPDDQFSMKIGNATYTEKAEAGEALIKALDAIDFNMADWSPIIGEYRGLNVTGKRVILRGWDAAGNPTEKSRYELSAMHEGGLSYLGHGETGAGLIRSLNHDIGKTEDLPAEIDRQVAEVEKEVGKLKKELEKPFDHEERLEKLIARQKEINAALNPTKDEPTKVIESAEEDGEEEDAPAKSSLPDLTDVAPPKPLTPLDILNEERGSIPLSGRPKYAKEAGRYKEQRAEEERGFMSTDPEIERRVRAAKRGVQKESLPSRLKEFGANVWSHVSREFEHLPDTAQFAPLRTDLLRLQKYKGIAADRVQREIAAIIKPLSKTQYDQFEWKALLADLKQEADRERLLPFGYTPEKVTEDLVRLDAIIENDPVLQEAWRRRQRLWEQLKQDYQRSMDAIGFDVSKKLTKDDYFRHQVLEYSREKALKGTGSKVRTPTGRGFLKARHGSTLDINANYVQAEFEVMAQMVYDTQLAKVIKNVDRHYNIRRQLEQEAKRANKRAMDTIMNGGDERAALVEKAMKDFSRRIGMHMKFIKDALGLDQSDHLTMDQIQELAEDMESPANQSARGVFKAISERKAFVKATLGEHFSTWEDMIPDTHEVWQPREGNMFYLADSIPAQLAKALQEGMMEEIGLSPDQLRKVLAMGSKREQYVIPKEARETLDDLSHKEHSFFAEINRHFLAHWKQLMLLSPRRIIRYNARNLTGDSDATFVGNPQAFAKYKQAASDLIPVIFKDDVLTGEAKEWADRGGYGSTLQMQELGDINDLKAFTKTLDREAKGGWMKAPAAVWNRYWQAARLSTDYRESIGRYAAYLSYLEQMQKNNGRPENFGASKPETVMAIPDIRDRAFKLSNELLGAYDRVSVAGQTMRSFWYPFWSWQEVNATRYFQLAKNAFDGQDAGSMARGAVIGTKKAAAFLIKMSAFWAALQAWNYLMFGDDEDELRETNPTVANRPHIIFGRDENGKVMYLAGIGALGDFLSWFGLSEFPGLVGDVMHDRLTLGEALQNAAKEPVNKIVSGLTPTVKMPVEMMSRQSYFPDVFNPRPVQDRSDYLANQTTFGPEIRALRGKPDKPIYGAEDLTGLLVQRTNPKAAAYGTWMEIEGKYLQRMGKDSNAIFWRSPRGEALSNWARAIQENDTDTLDYWKGEYERLEREKWGRSFTQAKMYSDMEKSLRAKAPLAGVSKAERDKIMSQLDSQEKRTLTKAEAHYKEVILQVLPDRRRRSFEHRLERQGWIQREPLIPSLEP